MGLAGLFNFGGTRAQSTHIIIDDVCNICIKRVECPVFQCEVNGNYGIFEGVTVLGAVHKVGLHMI